MKVKIKKLHEDAVIPKYAHDTDAGLDLTAIDSHYDYQNEVYVYSTGLAIEIPENHVGLLFPRSSIYKAQLSLANSVGVIDSGYRGEIKFIFRETSKTSPYRNYSNGDRIGQLIIIPYPKVEFEEVQDLDETDRNEGGFGSTGD